jgi:DNA-binding NarL/FixJ family response regulator
VPETIGPLVAPAPSATPGEPRSPYIPAMRRPAPGEGALAAPVTVAILAGDPVTGEGAAAFLGARREVRVLSADRRHEAEVVLILVNTVTEEALDWMRGAAAAAHGRGVGFVLVGDGVREHHVLRAVSCGPVSVIPRREADFERILRAVKGVHKGRLDMPDHAVGWLAGLIRSIHQDVLEPRGLTTAGLDAREVEVLRLLADGLGTPEISARLCYSERTIKNIIHGVLTRFDLRNRAQAVAFALRAGAL